MNETKLILLVEDNSGDEELAIRSLRRHRIHNEITVVRDGAEALDWFAARESGQLPHLVLLDLKLPKVDGLEVLRRIKSDPRTALVPVVVLSSSKEEKDVLAAYRAGANGYVVKPVDFDEFVEAVGALGKYWVLHNEPAPA